MSERGHIALYLLFSLAAATATGYGVYALMRSRQIAEPSEIEAAPSRPSPRPVAVPASAPTPEPAVEPVVDIAERDAVAPDEIEAPDRDTVLHGHPGVAGAIEPAEIERMIKRYSGRYDRCMRHARERSPLHRGELRLAFVIGATGSVEAVTAKSTVDAYLAECVMDVIRKLRFDKPSDGALVKVVYPMLFVPADPLE